MTVASRRVHSVAHLAVRTIQAERLEALQRLSGEAFDLTIDFIAYEGQHVTQALESVHTRFYVLISSTWLPRVLGLQHGAERLPHIFPSIPSDLPELTRRYIAGKASAETAVFGRWGRTSGVVVRLPVMSGPGDHTRRLQFYRARFREPQGVIAIGDVEHTVQIVSHLDLADALRGWIDRGEFDHSPIWDALPPHPTPWGQFLEAVARSDGLDSNVVALSQSHIEERIPALLVSDPWWRERFVPLSPFNIFHNAGVSPRPPREWLTGLGPTRDTDIDPNLRALERALIEEATHAGHH